MKIETQFDIGQEVWVVGTEFSRKTCSHCGYSMSTPRWVVCEGVGKPETIRIVAYRVGNTNIRYQQDTAVWREENAFLTRAEAQAECDNRNNEKAKSHDRLGSGSI